MAKKQKRNTFKKRRRNQMRYSHRMQRQKGGGLIDKLMHSGEKFITSFKNTAEIEAYLQKYSDLGLDKLTMFAAKMEQLLTRDTMQMNKINTTATWGKLNAGDFLKRTLDITNNIDRHLKTFNNVYMRIFQIFVKNSTEYEDEDAAGYQTNYIKTIDSVIKILIENTSKIYVMLLLLKYLKLGAQNYETKLKKPVVYDMVGMIYMLEYGNYHESNRAKLTDHKNFLKNPNLNNIKDIDNYITEKTKTENLIGISDFFQIDKSSLKSSQSPLLNYNLCRCYIDNMSTVNILKSFLDIFNGPGTDVASETDVASAPSDPYGPPPSGTIAETVSDPVIVSGTDATGSKTDATVPVIVSTSTNEVVSASTSAPSETVSAPSGTASETDPNSASVSETTGSNGGGKARFKNQVFKQRGGDINPIRITNLTALIEKDKQQFAQQLAQQEQVQPTKQVSIPILQQVVSGTTVQRVPIVQGQVQGQQQQQVNSNSFTKKELAEQMNNLKTDITKLITENKSSSKGTGTGDCKSTGPSSLSEDQLKQLISDCYVQIIQYLKLTKIFLKDKPDDPLNKKIEAALTALNLTSEDIEKTGIDGEAVKKVSEKNMSGLVEILSSLVGMGVISATLGGRKTRRRGKHGKHGRRQSAKRPKYRVQLHSKGKRKR